MPLSPVPCSCYPLLMSIVTKRGDTGETGLLYGGRVRKTDPRVEAYGSVDEAVSALGLARAMAAKTRVKETLLKVQRELFTVGGELATDAAEYDKLKKHFSVVTPQMTDALEAEIRWLESQVTLPQAFIIPGATQASAVIDVGRTMVRRAERRTVDLKDTGLLVNAELVRYLNRLSDLLFMLARYEEQGAGEVLTP